MSEWSHLPNAVHIDRILAHLETHPEKWTYTRAAVYTTARAAAWLATWDAQRYDVWQAAVTAARVAARDAAHNAASGAVLALIANDTCGYLLKEKPEHVELLASLGTDEAILLLPAVRAMSD
jgi:hypothetical protein